MFKLAIALSGLLLAAATDTVWWRTEGGSVIGHRDGRSLTCTLTMEDPSGRIAFAWGDGLPLRATVEREAWSLEPDGIARVAVRIGADWLAGGNGEFNITALTGRSSYMLVLEEPVEERLLAAREVTVMTPAGQVSIGVSRNRMRSLVTAWDRCRRVAT